jgi:hypothetical protein
MPTDRRQKHGEQITIFARWLAKANEKGGEPKPSAFATQHIAQLLE